MLSAKPNKAIIERDWKEMSGARGERDGGRKRERRAIQTEKETIRVRRGREREKE